MAFFASRSQIRQIHKMRLWVKVGLATVAVLFVGVRARAAVTPVAIPVIQNGPPEPVRAVAFSLDARRFATASGGNVQVWNRESGEVELCLTSHARISSVAWASDGQRLTTGGIAATGGLICVWDARSGRRLREWRAGNASVGSLSWSRDGRRLLAAGGGNRQGDNCKASACVWTPEGKLVHTLANYRASSAFAAFSADDRTVNVVYYEEYVGAKGPFAYSASTGRPVAAPNGTSIDLPEPGAIGVPRMKSWALLRFPASHDLTVTAVAPDRRWLVTCASLTSRLLQKTDGSLQTRSLPAFELWERRGAKGQWARRRSVEFGGISLTSLAVGKNAFAVGLRDKGVVVWNLRNSVSPFAIPAAGSRPDFAFSADGRQFAASHLWDLSGAQPKQGVSLSESGPKAFSPDGRYLVDNGHDAPDGSSGPLLDIRTGGRTKLRTGQSEEEERWFSLDAATFSADGQVIATIDDSNGQGGLHLWSRETGLVRNRGALANVRMWASAIAFAPRGNVLAVCGGEVQLGASSSIVALFDADTGRLLRKLETPAKDRYLALNLQFTPDGKTVESYGFVFPSSRETDADLKFEGRIWNVDTGARRPARPSRMDYLWLTQRLSSDVGVVIAPSGIEFRTLGNGQLKATLQIVHIAQSGRGATFEWLLTTPEGHFDASPGSARIVRWRVGDKLEVEPPPTMRRVPGLLATVLTPH